MKEQADRVSRLLYERFGDLGLGRKEPNEFPAVVDGNGVVLANNLGLLV